MKKTSVCIVGAGPAGVILAYLLAKQGIQTQLLEAEEDFDRNFRGDTVHPSTMEILEQLNLIDGLLKYPHTLVKKLRIDKSRIIDLSIIPSKFNYITLLHQKDFLKHITDQAKKFPNFKLSMKTNAQELILRKGKVTGVKCLQKGKWINIKANLVIGADGRFSRMRKVGGFESKSQSVPMDVLWFRLPKKTTDNKLKTGARLGKTNMLVMLEREAHWQLGFIIPKGEYGDLRKEGFPHFKKTVIQLEPHFKSRISALKDWKNVSLLSVESSMVKKWHRDGLLLIGDAAHVMSPVGGVGINFAVKDAVTAANILAGPIKNGTLKLSDLAKIQRRRKLPTKLIQKFQSIAQNQILEPTLNSQEPPFFIRFLIKLPFVQTMLARIIGIGFIRVKVSKSLL